MMLGGYCARLPASLMFANMISDTPTRVFWRRSGLSLPIIGQLLGHTKAQTTLRYAHLLDDPLRAATERAAAVITGKPAAAVVPIKGGRRG